MSSFWTTLDLGRGARRRSLEAELRAAIRSGDLREGERLPSSRTLAADLGLARGTVVEAYTQLRAEGYVEAVRGSGTRVAAVASALPAPEPREPGPPPPRFSLHPGLPDLTAFPHAAWAGELRRGLRRAPASSLGYGDPRGRRELREALAGYLARVRGAVADPDRIVVCGGFRHGLSLVLRATRARTVAMEDPCLDDHLAVAAAAGATVSPVPVDELGARTDLLAGDVAVLGPAHQYPLGCVLAPGRRAAAVAWARETGGLIVEDDYDAELRFDRAPVGCLQALDPEHVAYGGTASKTLAPGLRLGWLLLPERLVAPIVALRETEDVHGSATDQIAFAELLASGAYERHVRRMRLRYRTRRDRVVEALADQAPHVTAVGISAGLRVLIRLPAGESARDLVARAAERSVELFPSGENGVLVGYGALPEHAFEAGLDALVSLLAERPPE